MKYLVNFGIGRGGRFNNQGHLLFLNVGMVAKNWVEEQNFLAYENESKIIEENEDIVDLITDLGLEVEGDLYSDFCEKYGDLGKLVLNSCDGNYIGDYIRGEEAYHYDEDGDYDTTYGYLISSIDELTDKEIQAIKDTQNSWEVEQAFNIEL